MKLQKKLEKSLSVALAMRGMNQKKLAAKMECTSVYISNIMKNGKLSVFKLNQVAETLDFTLWEFVKLGEE
tara:strand:+ start:151 stop:363 length:213 start_codon:yes stop_codon:yes gene_type:complete